MIRSKKAWYFIAAAMAFMGCIQNSLICMEEQAVAKEKDTFIPHDIFSFTQKTADYLKNSTANSATAQTTQINTLLESLIYTFDGTKIIQKNDAITIGYTCSSSTNNTNSDNHASLLNYLDKTLNKKQKDLFPYQLIFLSSYYSLKKRMLVSTKLPVITPASWSYLTAGSRLAGVSFLIIAGWQLHKNGFNSNFFSALTSPVKTGLLCTGTLYAISRIGRITIKRTPSPTSLNAHRESIRKKLNLTSAQMKKPLVTMASLSFKNIFPNGDSSQKNIDTAITKPTKLWLPDDAADTTKSNSGTSLFNTIITTITSLLSYF